MAEALQGGGIRKSRDLLLVCSALFTEYTLQQRLRRALSYRVGATRPFAEAMPTALLEWKVREGLKREAALLRFWSTRVTEPMLRAEAARIASESKMPERLRELHRALGDDAVLILECLVRPQLVNRLIQERYHFDPSIHAYARHQAETLRERIMSGELDPDADDPRRSVLVLREHEAGSPLAGDLDGGLHVLSLSADQLRTARSSLPGLGQAGPVEESGRRVPHPHAPRGEPGDAANGHLHDPEGAMGRLVEASRVQARRARCSADPLLPTPGRRCRSRREEWARGDDP